jgi:hypothetical protein
MIGWMISSTILTLIVIPVLYSIWRSCELPEVPSAKPTVQREIPHEPAEQKGP